MKKPIICDYEYSNRAIYRRDLEKYINYLEFQNKELTKKIKLLKLQLNDDMDLPYIDMKPISRKKYKLTEIKTDKK